MVHERDGSTISSEGRGGSLLLLKQLAVGLIPGSCQSPPDYGKLWSSLGFTFNVPKSHLNPSQNLLFIGAILDTV